LVIYLLVMVTHFNGIVRRGGFGYWLCNSLSLPDADQNAFKDELKIEIVCMLIKLCINSVVQMSFTRQQRFGGHKQHNKQ